MELFWFSIYLIIQFLYGQYDSKWRLLSLLIIIPLLFIRSFWRSFWRSMGKFPIVIAPLKKKYYKIFIIITWCFLIFQIGHFIFRYQVPPNHIEDIAELNRKAIDVLFNHSSNPYSANIDPYSVEIKNENGIKEVKIFSGYKYMPLQLFFYAPFVLVAKIKGIFIGNFLIYLLMIASLWYFINKKKPGKLLPYFGVLSFLVTDFIFTLSFHKGSNDHLPTLLLFWAFYFFDLSWTEVRKNKRKFEIYTALFLALSLLTKQVPGFVFVLFLIGSGCFRILLMAFVFFLLFITPFLWSDWNSFYEQTVQFVLVRPARETSWLINFSPHIQKIITTSMFCFIILMAYLKKIGQNELLKKIDLLSLFYLSLLIFLLTAKMAPVHYFVWIVPFTIYWLFTMPDFKESVCEKKIN